jgi:hypothetical protein
MMLKKTMTQVVPTREKKIGHGRVVGVAANDDVSIDADVVALVPMLVTIPPTVLQHELRHISAVAAGRTYRYPPTAVLEYTWHRRHGEPTTDSRQLKSRRPYIAAVAVAAAAAAAAAAVAVDGAAFGVWCRMRQNVLLCCIRHNKATVRRPSDCFKPVNDQNKDECIVIVIVIIIIIVIVIVIEWSLAKQTSSIHKKFGIVIIVVNIVSRSRSGHNAHLAYVGHVLVSILLVCLFFFLGEMEAYGPTKYQLSFVIGHRWQYRRTMVFGYFHASDGSLSCHTTPTSISCCDY